MFRDLLCSFRCLILLRRDQFRTLAGPLVASTIVLNSKSPRTVGQPILVNGVHG
jgi:hypothetical protein